MLHLHQMHPCIFRRIMYMFTWGGFFVWMFSTQGILGCAPEPGDERRSESTYESFQEKVLSEPKTEMHSKEPSRINEIKSEPIQSEPPSEPPTVEPSKEATSEPSREHTVDGGESVSEPSTEHLREPNSEPVSSDGGEPQPDVSVEKRHPEPSHEQQPDSVPINQWLTGLQTSTVYATGIGVDSAGNSYIAGYYKDTLKLGTWTLTGSNKYDIFVAKLSPSGTPLWLKKAGSSGTDLVFDLAVDSAGNVYITGYFQGQAAFGSKTVTFTGTATGLFVAKMDTKGTFLWVTHGGPGDAIGHSIVVNSVGEAYVTGTLKGSMTLGSIKLQSRAGTSHPSVDAFLLKVGTKGLPQWGLLAGGAKTEGSRGKTLALQTAGGNDYVYWTGSFQGTAAFGSVQLVSSKTTSGSDSTDAFIVKIQDTGASGTILWAKKLGGRKTDRGQVILSDPQTKMVYVGGAFSDSLSLGSSTLASAGSTDIFLVQLDDSGTLQWGRAFGSTKSDSITALALGTKGLYATGTFQGNLALGSFTLSASGRRDIYTLRFDSKGIPQAIMGIHTSQDEEPLDMVVLGQSVWFTGRYKADLKVGASTLKLVGSQNAFILRTPTF